MSNAGQLQARTSCCAAGDILTLQGCIMCNMPIPSLVLSVPHVICLCCVLVCKYQPPLRSNQYTFISLAHALPPTRWQWQSPARSLDWQAQQELPHSTALTLALVLHEVLQRLGSQGCVLQVGASGSSGDGAAGVLLHATGHHAHVGRLACNKSAGASCRSCAPL